ncbi:unnamed protein product [Paramecium sonneborni]|uniref:Transmembrane protein n=1 Tax=Paramecium sonneborni TaxID=65129 RepID=A0A8S1KR80_9CILI|nr:unnamed protein product [Paramecium sonneborni]
MGFEGFLSQLILLQNQNILGYQYCNLDIKYSSKNIAMFIFSILQFFFRFIYLAHALFWKHYYFQSTIDTIVFYEDLLNLFKQIGIIGQIYLIVNMTLFLHQYKFF